MDSVLTVIAPEGALDEALLCRVRKAMGDLGGDSAAPEWLAPGSAADIPFALLAPGQAEAAARTLLDGPPFDIVAQPASNRRKKLLVADMDSTIVSGETLDELAGFAGLKEHIAAITARAMNGEIDFAAALRLRVGLLRDLPGQALDQTFARIAYTPGAATLVRTMRASGAYAVLVSGGFSYFTSRVRAHCGFDEDLANELEISDGRLTGGVIEPIRGRQSKLDTLTGVAAARHLPLTLALAVGDGANDLDMLKAAGLGIAFHAKPVVAAAAQARIDHNDLTALLFAQGYHRDEFVA